ncbi:MAG: hypothetical protein RL322_3273, partial [Pseudomonadota bacterium]
QIDSGASARKWTTLQADVGAVDLVGLDGLTLGADHMSLAINRSAADGTVVNYALTDAQNPDGPRETDLTIRTGSASEVTLTIDGARGEYTEARGHVTLDVYGFVQLEGEFAIQKASAPIDLTLATGGAPVQAEALLIGASNVNAFAGVGGGSSEAMGLQLTGVNFGLAMLGHASDPTRSWTALQATAANASLIGVSGLEASASDISLAINQAGRSGDSVVDFGLVEGSTTQRKTALSVAAGISDSITMSMEGAQGELLRASANVSLDAFGFLQAQGSVAIEKRRERFYLNDGVDTDDVATARAATEIDADLLTIGATGLDAFIGLNGGTSQAQGLALQDLDLGLALMTERLPEGSASAPRQFTSLKAQAGSLSLVGVDGLVATGSDLAVEINRGIAVSGGQPDVVVDHAFRQFEVLAGPDAYVTLDSDGQFGELTRASGQIRFDAWGFAAIEGQVSIEQATRAVVLAPVGSSSAETVQANVLTVTGRELSAFVGTNGGSDDQVGLDLSGADFALMLATDRADAGRSWTALKATAASASFDGIEGLSASATDITLAINQAGKAGDQVIDFAGAGATAVALDLGEGESLTLDFEGERGELISAAAQLDLDVFGFFSVRGAFGFESRSQDVTLSDGSTIEDARVVTLGGKDVSAFAGINGGFDADGELIAGATGLSLGSVDFGLALVSDPDDSARNFTSLQAEAGSAGLVGIDGLVLQANQLLVNVNQGVTVAATPASQTKVNTRLSLSWPVEFGGTVSFVRAAAEGRPQDTSSLTIDRNATEAEVQAAVLSALESLDGIGPDNVLLSGSRVDGYEIEFVGDLAGAAVTDITVALQATSATFTVSTVEAANPGANEIKQINVQALRDAPGPVTVNAQTLVRGEAALSEANELIFSSPRDAGAYTVFFVADGLVQETRSAVPGVSETQRLTLTKTATAPASVSQSTATELQKGSAGQAAPVAIVFKADRTIQEYQLFALNNPGEKVKATYRGVTATAQTISEMRAAYAELLTGSSANVAGISIVEDTAFATKNRGQQRFVVSFDETLIGSAVPATGFKFFLGSAARSSNGYSYTTIGSGAGSRDEIQQLVVSPVGGGSFTLSLTHGGQTYTTTGIEAGANAATVRYALNAALGQAGSVDVVSATKGEYRITFGGALSGQDLQALTVNISRPALGTSGSFQLAFNPSGTVETTRNISWIDDGAALARRIQTELAMLGGVGSGNVQVSLNAAQSGSDRFAFDIRFIGELAQTSLPQLVANGAGLVNASTEVRTLTQGVDAVSQQQVASLGSEALNEGFRLTLSVDGKSYQTGRIAGNANAVTIQQALSEALAKLSGAQIAVSRSGDDLTLTLGGSLAGRSLALVNVRAESALAQGTQVTRNFVVGDPSANISSIQSAYAQLLGTAPSNISVQYDSSFLGGERYVVRFVGDLLGVDIADKGISVTGTALDYRLLGDGVPGVAAVQRLVVDRDVTTAGTFRLSITAGNAASYTTAPIALGASAAEVQAAIRAAGSNAASLQGIAVAGASDDYRVTFGGPLLGQDMGLLRAAAVAVDPELPSGNFQISIDGARSDPIVYSTDSSILASRIETALRALSAIGSDGVAVSFDASESDSRRAAFRLEFADGALAFVDVPDLTSHFASLDLGSVAPINIVQGQAKSGELQSVRFVSTARSVELKLGFSHGGQGVQSALIDSGMTRAEVQAIVDAALDDLSAALDPTRPGFVATAEVAFWNGRELQVRFGGSLLGVDVAPITVTEVLPQHEATLTVLETGSTTDIQAIPQKTLVLDFGLIDAEQPQLGRKTVLEALTGPAAGDQIVFTMDGQRGELLEARGQVSIDAFGFFQVAGEFALEKSTDQVTVFGPAVDDPDTQEVDESRSVVNVDKLTVGASGLQAFVGTNGGTADEIGFKIGDAPGIGNDSAAFAVAVLSQQVTGLEPSGFVPRKWTALKAEADHLSFVGIDGLTASGSQLSVEINRKAADGSIVDFATSSLTVTTGTGETPPTMTLDMAGVDGQLLRARGTLDIDVFGFVQLSGGFGIEKKTGTVTLNDEVKNDQG